MKLIHKTYRFQLKPNKEQEMLLNKHFGCSRFVYNYFLNERKEQYLENKKSNNYYVQAKTLTELKKKEEYIWLKEVNSQMLQYTLRHLENAYLSFFRGNAQFPRFKSKKSKNSFTIPQHIEIVNNKLKIPKFKEGIKINLHQELLGQIKHITISKTPTGKYFVSILTEQEYTPSKKTGKKIGIDLGLKDFVITSNGIKYKNNKYTKKYERKLKKSQKHLSRKQKGSNGFEKQRLKVALIHEKIVNTRTNNLHKVSKEIVSKYDVICLEDLNIKGMIKNHRLAKHIADASWGTFVRFVEYKANWNDKTVVKINRFYPSSKTCSNCGYIKQDLKLFMREWVCPNCNTKLDRDYNAAKNIYREGLKIIKTSAGTVDNTDGEKNKSYLGKHISMKSETQPMVE